MTKVFVSRPTVVTSVFQAGLDAFLRFLRTHDLDPQTIGSGTAPLASPLDEVINLMEKCAGTIVLGYPQIEVRNGLLKGAPITNLVLPTEWNHIETALAYARRRPLLLVHHTSVVRGVFDRGALNRFIYKIDLSDPGWCLKDPFLSAFENWRRQVLEPSSTLNHTAASSSALDVTVPSHAPGSTERGEVKTKIVNRGADTLSIESVTLVGHDAKQAKDFVLDPTPRGFDKCSNLPYQIAPRTALNALFSADSIFYANLCDDFFVRVLTEDGVVFDSSRHKFRS
ncbi:MAG: hypothetical protein NTW87_26065 [Planctomycetota bacterium]|nr:hypothetical protein [Planctomycetota bacterium]